jgi:hypothetical protein
MHAAHRLRRGLTLEDTMHRHSSRASLRIALLAAALVIAPVAMAGPPLLCDPFDTAGAASLPWGKGWNQASAGYDTDRLVDDTSALLVPGMPVIARMETLRRAAIYASADGAKLRRLSTALAARIASANDPRSRALALFDAGYFAETLEDIARLQRYDMPGIGKVDAAALRAVLEKGDGSRHIAQALRLQPADASMRFAAALVAEADARHADRLIHARAARAGARSDRLLALNIRQID